MEHSKEFPINFYNYILLENIQEGESGNIYLAITNDSIKRLVVIKRPFQRYFEAEEFHRIFKNEISINAKLNHPNIVKVNTYAPKSDYVELELVRGKSLRDLFNKHRDANQYINLSYLRYIFLKACNTLDYIHRFKDETSGKALNVVYQNLAPHHLMISYDGDLKLLDFGVSKATSFIEQTKLGMLKSKVSYSAPEVLDPYSKSDTRADIFSLGVIFWEMLTLKKLFTGESVTDVIERVRNMTILPPSKGNPNCGIEWDLIVMKALQRDPKNRYQSMSEFAYSISGNTKNLEDELDIKEEVSEWIQKIYYRDFQNEQKKIQNLMSDLQAHFPPEKQRKLLTMKGIPIGGIAGKSFRVVSRLSVAAVFMLICALTFNLVYPEKESNLYTFEPVLEQNYEPQRYLSSILEDACNIEFKNALDLSQYNFLGNIKFTGRNIENAYDSPERFLKFIKDKTCKHGATHVMAEKDGMGKFLRASVYQIKSN